MPGPPDRRNVAHQGAPPRRAKVNEAGDLIHDMGLGPISRFYFASKYQRPRTLFLVLKTDHRQLAQRAHPGSPPDFLSWSSRSSSPCFSWSSSFFLASTFALTALISAREFCCVSAFCGSG